MNESKSFHSVPLGVDLIEIDRARSFYRAHKNNLHSFFSPKEISEIRRCRKPHEKLAVRLAAKEAVYKALEHRRAGLLNFRDISVSQTKENRLSVKIGKTLSTSNAGKLGLRLLFLKKKGYVVVQCHGKSKACAGI